MSFEVRRLIIRRRSRREKHFTLHMMKNVHESKLFMMCLRVVVNWTMGKDDLN